MLKKKEDNILEFKTFSRNREQKPLYKTKKKEPTPQQIPPKNQIWSP